MRQFESVVLVLFVAVAWAAGRNILHLPAGGDLHKAIGADQERR